MINNFMAQSQILTPDPAHSPLTGSPMTNSAGPRSIPEFMRPLICSEVSSPSQVAKHSFVRVDRASGRLPGNQPWLMFIGDLKKY
jgi:hypothetical protein